MTKQNNAAVFAQAFRHFQADFVSEGHARTYSLSAMLKNLQSTDPDKHRGHCNAQSGCRCIGRSDRRGRGQAVCRCADVARRRGGAVRRRD